MNIFERLLKQAIRQTGVETAALAVTVVGGTSGADSGQIQGTAADNATAVGNPVAVAGLYATAPADHANGEVATLLTDIKGRQIVAQGLVYPSGSTPITAASGNVANAAAVATLDSDAAKTTYITGFEVTATGATLGLPVIVTVVGTISGTLSYIFAAPAGVLVEATPLIIEFPVPIPASAVDTDIVVTLPALGGGNTNAAVVAHGFKL